MESEKCETYFLATSGNEKHLYFDLYDIVDAYPDYIDIFDQTGYIVASYKLNKEKDMYERNEL